MSRSHVQPVTGMHGILRIALKDRVDVWLFGKTRRCVVREIRNYSLLVSWNGACWEVPFRDVMRVHRG